MTIWLTSFIFNLSADKTAAFLKNELLIFGLLISRLFRYERLFYGNS